MAHDEQDCIDGWRTYSNWIDSLRDNSQIFLKYDNDPNFKSKLISYQTNRERFEFIWNNEELRNEISRLYTRDAQRLSTIKREGNSLKSQVISKKMRDLGNKSFKDGRYLEALKQYTEAVRYAPYPEPDNNGDIQDNTLAFALANRSAALYSLTRYRLCLLDIDLATKYGYPEANMFKLLIRKVKCLHILSVWANDVEQIKERLRTMMNKAETLEYIKTEIANMFEFLDQTQPELMEKDESDVEDETIIKISNVSKLLPQAADCVEMSCDPDKGRYLLTNKDVSFGRLLIAEDPFVCNLAPTMRDKHCYNCFSRLHNCGLACTACTQVSYCSIDCLEANKQIHTYECNGLLDFQHDLGVAYLVTHIMFKINFNLNSVPIYTRKNLEMKSLDEVLQIPHSNWPDLVYKNDYAAILSLMDHAEDYDYDELMGYTLTSAYLLTAFIDLFSTKHPECLSEKQAQLVTGSVILRHILQLQTNLISILDQNLQNLVTVGNAISDIEEKPIGIGLYPTISLLNHGCQPNIISIFHRNKFVARASNSLECGTEINYCYGPSFSRMSKKDRQKRLKDQYFFTCNCDCCSNDRENHNRALVCPRCRGPVIYNQDFSNKCMDCKQENLINVERYLSELNGLRLKLEKLQTNENNDTDKLAQLKTIEDNLDRLVYWRHPLFVQVKSRLIECAEELEDLESALKYCKEELDLSDKTFGENSIETIITKLKYINLDWQRLYYMIEDSQCEQEKVAAIGDLRNLLTTVSMTRGRLKDLLNSTSILGAESTFDSELKFLSTIQSNINNYIASMEAPADDSKESKTD
uniref:Protein-lysine N-methyltransferase SMYD4 n=1 Tax=Aceria tosichella TaxID=561515 RepID=A0A6G1S3Z9_9ACAR